MPEPSGTQTSGVKLSDLIPVDLDRLDATLKQQRSANAELAKTNLPKLAVGVMDEKVDQALRGVLDCDVFGLLAQAWAKARELHEFTDKTQHPPDEVSSMFLGEHSLSVEVHPTVDVAIGQLAKFSLRFTVELEAAFRMAELTIQAGYIKQIGKCDCEVSAVLKYDGIELHKPLKSKRIALIGAMVLVAPGVAIA
jgi:hypothetical protein